MTKDPACKLTIIGGVDKDGKKSFWRGLICAGARS